ncbi:GNAT family N-acetyltransferase [Caulobacter sp. NIBR1757]|uniref:GNAT family N-acetyltransferase n=1 Tax=Caulobacter sp. NIBR1757 TaxID=3016000 RepID=UPI0022F10BF5|nr:GNAT family N-acetyltransferase [Caulobacter sp. NIBR1757]WGM40245.1 L-methionine sulfoximine/L-methionine sulfone acetyltransferase [Caulobacter sp. NIBR1757]
MIVRDATEADAPALAAIYGDACLHGFGTFEEVPPEPAEMARRLAEVKDLGLPYLVAEEEGEVVGLCYAKPFRPRSAYRFTVEDSVYVAPGQGGKGVGRLMLAELIRRCEPLGLRQMTAVIGDSLNAGSIGLHAALGFEHTGVFKAVGWKHGRWVDIVFMQLSLNGGDSTEPSGRGQTLREF